MFLLDRLHPAPVRLALRYPHPVRLGQVPSPAGFTDFLSYLAATQGFTAVTTDYSVYPVNVPGPTDVKMDYSGGPIGGATTQYGFHRFALPLDELGQPNHNALPVEVWSKVMSAFLVSPYWAAWTGAGGTATSPPGAPPPSAAGVDLAQITHVALPAAALPAGAQFSLQVTVLNAGSVPWTTGYMIVLQAPAGTPTGAPQAFATLPAAVAPGQSTTVTLTAWAPTQPGTYAYTVGMYNPGSQIISPLVTAGLVVIAATAGSSVVPTTTAGYVSQQEFGSYVQAMLASQAQLQGAVAGMQAGAAQQYSPTYIGQPGPPSMTPIDQQAGAMPVVVQPAAVSAGLFGLPWWLWLLGALAVGGGVYYVYYRPGARRRRAGSPGARGTTVTVRPGPRRRRIVRRRPR